MSVQPTTIYFNTVDSPLMPRGARAEPEKIKLYLEDEEVWKYRLFIGDIYLGNSERCQIEKNTCWITENEWLRVEAIRKEVILWRQPKCLCKGIVPVMGDNQCVNCVGYCEPAEWQKAQNEARTKGIDEALSKSLEGATATVYGGGETLREGELKRRESMARRFDFIPKNGEDFFIKAADGEVYPQRWVGSEDHIALWHIGNIHRTKEAAEAWGKEYAQYFTIPNNPTE